MSARLFAASLRRGARGLVTAARPASRSGAGSGGAWARRAVVAGVVAVPTIYFLTRDNIELDTRAAPKGRSVSVADVIQRREGPEIWVVIDGEVYDMTKFLEDHPGGRDIIVANRSRDVTPIFKPRHPSDQLMPGHLPADVKHLGPLEPASADELGAIKLQISEEQLAEDERVRVERQKMEERGLGVIVNMKDFEKFAEPLLSKVAWAYYASAGDDEITKLANASAYQKVLFRPRVLRRVEQCDASTRLMGCPSSLPIYIAPAAMAKLGHPLGEINLTRGAGSTGIIQGISSNASCSMDEMLAEREEGQPLFYQLYVNRDRAKAEELVRKIDAGKFDAIMLTADAPVGGKRERDIRLKGEFEGPAGGVAVKSKDTAGVAQAMFAGVDPNLDWDDVRWLRGLTSIPVMVKGVQCVEDALLAYAAGCDGIVISNHGGRQLDTTRPALDVLLEIRRLAPHLLRPEFRAPTGPSADSLAAPDRLTPPDRPDAAGMPRRFEIFIDGGVSRGTDVVKALCLGANGVGIGRGFLYAQSVAGEEGVEHAVEIMKSEIELAMRLLGATRIEQLRPSMVEVVGEPPRAA
ncbi:hypothetical protein CC85DRAFT_258870 [Cutaneotrichosporon oleaginosum]|uniref:L-mandelate dehydrogenase n=1 Tax=Cutaneotrichosporon oleaginosum TaxID=879819 RepID=A0A0J0XQH6_9TREE|nr:uncharacterized protein CC85DRAFT_258870 [Cutaneotrichosporon oleaginosum]KLT43343.1 hypothetical protein CC85DRAFT_258870 [Cutaneotrichosporon oleaginosum]TXT14395.1 hypothetical protein COLE_00588 [Cutaneotrichosporon oleaginosum]